MIAFHNTYYQEFKSLDDIIEVVEEQEEWSEVEDYLEWLMRQELGHLWIAIFKILNGQIDQSYQSNLEIQYVALKLCWEIIRGFISRLY